MRQDVLNAESSMRVVVRRSTLNGPVPIGFSAKTVAPASFQAFGSTMYRAANFLGKIASAADNVAVACVVISTTRSLIFLADATPGSSVPPITVLRPSALVKYSTFATTESALNGSPFENLTPLRRVNCHVVGDVFFHEVARRGRTSPFVSTIVSASKIAAYVLMPGVPGPSLKGFP